MRNDAQFKNLLDILTGSHSVVHVVSTKAQEYSHMRKANPLLYMDHKFKNVWRVNFSQLF